MCHVIQYAVLYIKRAWTKHKTKPCVGPNQWALLQVLCYRRSCTNDYYIYKSNNTTACDSWMEKYCIQRMGNICPSARTTQIIRYRATATLRRPQISNTQPQNKGGFTKSTGTSYNFDKVWSGAPDGRFGKWFLIRDANNLENTANSLY